MTTQPTTSGTGNARAKGPSSRRYTAAQKEHAVRLVGQLAAETGKEAGAISRVAHQLGFGAESVRQWVRQADIDEGRRPGVTSSEAARIRDRVREPGAPPSERDPHVEPRRSSRLRRPPATSLARPRGTPGARSRAHLPHAAGDAAHRLRGTEPATVGSSTPGRSPDPHPGRPPVGELLRYGIHTLMSLPRRKPATTSGGTRWPGSWRSPGSGATSVAEG